MVVPLLQELASGQAPTLVPLSVEQYHEMLRRGIIVEGAPIELIDGLLVRKDRSTRGGNPMAVGPWHILTIKRLETRLDEQIAASDCHTRNQAPVTIPLVSEPEPDISLAKGQPEAYRTRHPWPADLLAAMEVSDSSLNFDRTTKLRLYASAGIAVYWIVNLPDSQIEVYESPLPAEGRYAERTIYHRSQSIPLILTTTTKIEIAVDDVLPASADPPAPKT